MIEVIEKVPEEAEIPTGTIKIIYTPKLYIQRKKKSKPTDMNTHFAKDVIIAVLTIYIAVLRDTFACKSGLATFVCAAILVAAITILLFSFDVNRDEF